MTQSHRYILLGAGGHAKVITDMIHRTGDVVVGLVDRDPSRQSDVATGATFMTQTQFINELEERGHLPLQADGIILSIGNNTVRRRLYEQLSQYIAPAIIDPSAEIGAHGTIGAGSVIMPGVRIGADVTIVDNCIINTGATIAQGVRLAPHVHVAPRVHLEEEVHVGELTLIGARSVIKRQIHIEEHVIIGAGSMVDKNIATTQKWIQKDG